MRSTTDSAPSQDLITEMRDRLLARLDGRRADLAVELARAAYRRILPSDLESVDAEAAAELFAGALEFLDERRPGELALRAFVAPSDGLAPEGTVVEAACEDGPFLVSTAVAQLRQLGEEPAELLHPVLGTQRDDQGRLRALVPARSTDQREAWIHVRLGRVLDEGPAQELIERLESVLGDARAAAADGEAMRRQAGEAAFDLRSSAGARYPLEEIDEADALLHWLLDDNYILLGYREYDLAGEGEDRAAAVRAGSGLGLLRDEESSAYARPVPLRDVPAKVRERMEGGDLVLVSRTNRASTVHRHEQMVYVGSKKVRGDGAIMGEHRFVGLLSDKAYGEPGSAVPVLRQKLSRILDAEDIVAGSHEERTLRSLFDALPKTELFEAPLEGLRATLVELLRSEQHDAVRLLCRGDPFRRTVSAVVSLPRDRFNPELRQRVQRLLVERFGAVGVDYHLSLSERDQALLHFVLHLDGDRIPEVALDEIEREILELSRTWADGLAAALDRRHGRPSGRALHRTWGHSFPPGYRDRVSAQTAVDDIAELEALAEGPSDVRMAMCRHEEDPAGRWRFKLYRAGEGVELSAFLPILESLGLVVVEEVPHRIDGPVGPTLLHDFGVRLGHGEGHGEGPGGIDVAEDGPRLADAALAMWRGDVEADALNRLVLRAGLTWDDVNLLRAYRRYRRQVGTAFTEAYLDAALVGHPEAARSLVQLFAARFDPRLEGDDEQEEAARDRVMAACDAVERLDQDRILRGYLGLLDATVRTNRYRRPRRPWLSLKFDSRAVPDMPKPLPDREVFVAAPDMEGIHLRGGLVARGGVRWSDRREDYRTEVLGLMKAQMVKNAVIVPTGSKGGFVLRSGGGPQDVRRAYETYVRGLLDVTDNVESGRVARPPDVRARDGDDPYLVVAPDRGTAALSDVANAIAEEYGFWLGDAFASGGSRGYDHKAMGITARGAWTAVCRHLRECGVDPESDEVTVAGVGDMSGDVFGNGMLSSDRLRLVAAFDHRHIFLDPDPDPAASYEERRRLYDLPGSSWDDYKRSCISEGGGVWSRAVKEVALSPQAQALLRLDVDRLSPPELVSAILRAPADVLFAGGIGTFVKAGTESHAEVGDRANDAVRVDASELRARVVGEGANLALTQRARIQYARRGGRCNTDAIDNAAGVDTSDREVNLKILLAMVPGLTGDERDRVLEGMTDEVAALAVGAVQAQTMAISQEVGRSPRAMDTYEAFMAQLEGVDWPARLDREVEALPTTEEMVERAQAEAGLTRPELAVLLGYAKVDLSEVLSEDPLVEDEALRPCLEGAFPPTAVTRYGDLLPGHRLRRELVATVLANDLANRMGVTYARRVAVELGTSLPVVAGGYWVAREASGAGWHWEEIDELSVDPAVQLRCQDEVAGLVDACLRTYLRGPLGTLREMIERDRPAFAALDATAPELGAPRQRADHTRRFEEYLDAGVPEPVANRLAGLPLLTLGPDIADLAREHTAPVTHVGDLFCWLGDRLMLDELAAALKAIEAYERLNRWERWQRRGLVDDLRKVRRWSAAVALERWPSVEPSEAVERLMEARAPVLERARSLLRQWRFEPEAGLSAVAVIVRTLREFPASRNPLV